MQLPIGSWANYCLFLWNRVLYLEVLPLLHRSPFLKSLIFQTWNLWTRRGFNRWHLWKNNGSITALCSSTCQKNGCLPHPFLFYWSANVHKIILGIPHLGTYLFLTFCLSYKFIFGLSLSNCFPFWLVNCIEII